MSDPQSPDPNDTPRDPPRDPLTPPPVPQEAKPVVLREPKSTPMPPPLPPKSPSPLPASKSARIPAEWQGIFEPNEQIVWQGRGRTGAANAVQVSKSGVVSAAIMIGFSIFWMAVASRGGGIIWLFGLIFLYKGARSLMTALRGTKTGPLLAQGPYYTLTTKAAYIGRTKGDLDRIEVARWAQITLQDRPVPSVHFAVKQGRTDVPYGFENIDNAADVYAMMRGIERGAR